MGLSIVRMESTEKRGGYSVMLADTALWSGSRSKRLCRQRVAHNVFQRERDRLRPYGYWNENLNDRKGCPCLWAY
jgi:hypothetical protein